MFKGSIKDYGSGGLFLLLGGGVAINALTTMRIGSGTDIGPGYFPLILGCLLAFMGLLIVLRGLRGSRESITLPPARAVIAIIAAILIFAVLVAPLGFVPTTFIAILVASLASSETSVRYAAALAAGLTAFCTAVFIWGLGMPLPVFGPLLRGWVS